MVRGDVNKISLDSLALRYPIFSTGIEQMLSSCERLAEACRFILRCEVKGLGCFKYLSSFSISSWLSHYGIQFSSKKEA